jgi:hypothetical protein
MRGELAPIRVKAAPAGRISMTLESIAAAFKGANSGTDCRWVYDPHTKPELSNVTSRQADGYVIVRAKDLGPDIPHGMEPDQPIRVADTVLMAIPEKAKMLLEKERSDSAKDAIQSIDRTYYQAIEEMEIPGAESKHRPSPIGRTVIEEREFQYDVEQRTGEE